MAEVSCSSDDFARPFLTAEWRHLAMLNYEVDPSVVEPYVPQGTELDFFRGKTYLSVVGFLFLDTRLMGWPIPLHRNFEEVNLRLYVRCDVNGERRRGVVFIKELVPRWAVAKVARYAYNENYQSLPMRHEIRGLEADGEPPEVSYQWKVAGRWHGLRMTCESESRPLASGSEEEFIAEHYWGYSAQRDGGTLEYRVEHPSWRVYPARTAELDCPIERLYGPQFVEPLSAEPASAFLADGSPVSVHPPRRLPEAARGKWQLAFPQRSY